MHMRRRARQYGHANATCPYRLRCPNFPHPDLSWLGFGGVSLKVSTALHVSRHQGPAVPLGNERIVSPPAARRAVAFRWQTTAEALYMLRQLNGLETRGKHGHTTSSLAIPSEEGWAVLETGCLQITGVVNTRAKHECRREARRRVFYPVVAHAHHLLFLRSGRSRSSRHGKEVRLCCAERAKSTRRIFSQTFGIIAARPAASRSALKVSCLQVPWQLGLLCVPIPGRLRRYASCWAWLFFRTKQRQTAAAKRRALRKNS